MTILYNTQSQQVLGYYPDGYLVNGKPSPTYDNDVVELIVVNAAKPEHTENQKASTTWTADINAGTWTQSWTVTDKTEEEIQAEKDAAQAALEASSEYKIQQLEGVITELITILNEKRIAP